MLSPGKSPELTNHRTQRAAWTQAFQDSEFIPVSKAGRSLLALSHSNLQVTAAQSPLSVGRTWQLSSNEQSMQREKQKPAVEKPSSHHLIQVAKVNIVLIPRAPDPTT